MDASASQTLLMYLVVPLWVAAGFADWECHRRADIEHTGGIKESLIHLLMFVEVGGPLLAALFLQINGPLVVFMGVMFLVHEATALWDVRYAVTKRSVSPWEQHVHSFLEMLPLMGLLLITVAHWGELKESMTWPPTAESFALRLKSPPLPAAYLISLLTAIVLFGVLPYANELWRCVHARRRRLEEGCNGQSVRRRGSAP